MKRALLTLLILFVALPAFALVEPGEELQDPALEARARAIAKDIRCPVCESQNIENSSADLARDLRILIRKKIEAGQSDEQVIEYLRERYGDSILLDPPMGKHTMALWAGPFVILILGGVIALVTIRKGAKT
jgi:cytochrome c-type biogenesis protein CcmH